MATRVISYFFFFNDTATTEIYTLSLHDALPILCNQAWRGIDRSRRCSIGYARKAQATHHHKSRTSSCQGRSEEHTSELQSRLHLVCRLLLEKKKTSKHCGTSATQDEVLNPVGDR